ncbi:MAG: hypothetical protein SGILL_002441 [Bacillariaceae sp.]
MKWFRNAVDFLSGAQARKEREMMEEEYREHMDNGKTSYHSSWRSDFGLDDFQQALAAQDELLGEEDSPRKIETFVWIAHALHKQNELEESMNALKSAFRIQLQSGDFYESKTAGILDAMVVVLEGMGTPRALKQAHIISNSLFRIKYRLYGKGFGSVDSDAPSPVSDTSSITQSLFEETEGDLLFHESRQEALAKYKMAALVEYREWGSHNLNFALLERKIALSGMSTPTGFPFEARVTPGCQTATCRYIRQGDDLLFQTRYEEATSFYLQAAASTASHAPSPISHLANGSFVLCLLASLTLLCAPVYGRRLQSMLNFKTAKKNENTQTLSITSITRESIDAQTDTCATLEQPETIPSSKQESKPTLAEDYPSAGQVILEGEAPNAKLEKEFKVNSETSINSASFESVAALMQQSDALDTALEVFEGKSN